MTKMTDPLPFVCGLDGCEATVADALDACPEHQGLLAQLRADPIPLPQPAGPAVVCRRRPARLAALRALAEDEEEEWISGDHPAFHGDRIL